MRTIDGIAYRESLPSRSDGSEPTALALPEVNNVHAETAHFVACLRDGRAPIQTHVHGIDVLKLILAAYQSEAEKRTVALTRDA